MRVLATIANYGTHQLEYLKRLVHSLQNMEGYQVSIVIHSNIPLGFSGVHVISYENPPGKDWNCLPWKCRETIYERRGKFDIYLYTDNDHLYEKRHFDLFMRASAILPENRILGFMQFEEYPEMEMGKFYPAWHAKYQWDEQSVEDHSGMRFAQFTNPHHAGFMLTNEHLQRLIKQKEFTFHKDRNSKQFNTKVRAASDVYLTEEFTKVITTSHFAQGLLHHMPNKYLALENGHFDWKTNRNFDKNSMNPCLARMQSDAKFTIIIPTMWRTAPLLKMMVKKYQACRQVGEILIVDNDRQSAIPLPMNKVRILGTGSNMFVNPAWNLGVSEASFDNIAIVNDDIWFEEVPELLTFLADNLEDRMVFGPAEQCFPQRNIPNPTSLSLLPARNKWAYGFGVFMVMKKTTFIPIPEDVLVWHGDNLQWRVNTAYYFQGINIITKMRSTSSSLNLSSEIKRNDARNYKKYWQTDRTGA